MTTILPPPSAVQSIMEHVPIGVVGFDAHLKVVGASRHATAMLDFTERDLVGISLHDAIANALGTEAAQNLGIHAAAVIKSGKPTAWNSCRLTAGGGQRFVDWEVRPMEIAGGKGALLTLIDVTEREQAKMTITATEKSLRLFSEAVLDHALIMTDIRGRIMDCNAGAAMITGFPKEELVGQPISLIYTRDDTVAGVPEQEWRTAASEGNVSHTRWHERKDGGRYFAHGIITAHVHPDERPSFTVAFRDTTEAVRQAERLERVSAERKEAIETLTTENANLQQFASVASHDMQEPLRMVTSYLTMLRSRYSGNLDVKASEYIEIAIDGAQRMGRLIRSLLDIARIDHGDVALQEVSADLAFEEAQKNLQQVVSEASAIVECGGLGAVYADKDMLIRLFQNLLGNALKYVAKGQRPRVQVDAIDQSAMRAIRIKDNGIGVSLADQARIFDAFERVHGRGEYSGTGLGLAICKGIVQRHGGTLTIESEPGRGSTFIITLPRKPAG
ncbi:MAG: PAS domain S-box protein [Planctomycetes bacterium]|nr:PAS domain S-box protein [Planctomycetota bacterium]